MKIYEKPIETKQNCYYGMVSFNPPHILYLEFNKEEYNFYRKKHTEFLDGFVKKYSKFNNYHDLYTTLRDYDPEIYFIPVSDIIKKLGELVNFAFIPELLTDYFNSVYTTYNRIIKFKEIIL